MNTQRKKPVATSLILRGLVLAVLMYAAVGCSGWKVTTESSDLLPRYTVRSLALVPFTVITTPQVRDQGDFYFSTPQGARQQDMSLAIPSDVEPKARQAAVVPAYAAERITELFWKRLQARQGLQIVPLGDSSKVSAAESTGPKVRPETIAATTAKKLKADAVVIGFVSMYQERVGSRLGANPAASVGFEVKVVAADGRVLWIGNYYERQRPLTEDFLGFVQRFGMFVTAEELAEYGVDEMLKEFPFGVGNGQ
ncbi:MAG: hypothetical protein OEY28_12790 [Nitrospira sp.]|nr:hypothetical protein [Nitrospira sp.]